MLRQARKSCESWAIIVTFLAGLSIAGTALAQQPASPPSSPPQRERLLTPEDRTAMAQIYWHRVQERLGLTDQQMTDIRSLLDSQRAAARADVQSLIAARKQLRSLLDQPTVDPTAVQAMGSQVKALQAKLFDARLQTQLALRGKLTPEQWQGWLALRKGPGHRGIWRRPASGAGI